MAASLHLNIPSPFYEAWGPLLELGERFIELPRPNDNTWVLLALARKTAKSMYALAALASLELWGEALIMGRVLFETELRARSLLQGDYIEQVEEYLAEVGIEQSRLKRKAKAGRSASAKVLAATRLFDEGASKSRRPQNVREQAKLMNMERLYDLPYWIASTFAHAGILSLSEWNKELAAADPGLQSMFSFGATCLAG
jgi:hypothetical protein